ncbi:MAG TPA: hypothetical protein VFI39_07100 [Gemmatimonadales bacterium]|nr:hypothetical protein [Gemmatimonadales bacterium]
MTAIATPFDDSQAGRRILIAGATVGLLDALFVVVTYVWIRDVTTTRRIFQGIAAGILGKSTFDGGAGTEILGVILHFTIAYTWTLVYFIISRRWTSIRRLVQSRRGAAIAGPVWGIVMWLGMDLIVVPLSHARPTPVGSGTFWFFLLQHAVMLGPAIVWIVR